MWARGGNLLTLLALHIPDGFIGVPMAALGWLTALVAMAVLSRSFDSSEDRLIPFAGTLAAFVFAAQTLQFPVPGGTSGHLVGAGLVCILLGPGMGATVLTAVLLLQALVFGIGGLLALGWNFINMALLMGVVSCAIFQRLKSGGVRTGTSAFFAAWFAAMYGALATSMELAAAGASPLQISLPALLVTQSMLGVGEGLITAGAVTFLERVRPELLCREGKDSTWMGRALLVALGLVCFLPPSVYGLVGLTGGASGYSLPLVFLSLLGLQGLCRMVLASWAKRS